MSSSPGNETVPSVTLRTGTPWGKEQTPSARAAMQFQEIVARATPETVRSGILDTLPPRLLPLRELNGSEDSPVVSQDEWQRCLEALLRGRLPDAASATPASSLITIDEIDARAAAHHARGHVPIFIGVFEYHALRGRAWVMIERAAQEAALAGDAAGSPATSDLFEPRRCFLASAVLPALYAGFTTLPYAHRGRRVSFVLPSDTLLGSAPELTDLTIDFGDGRGPRSMKRDEPVTITYGEAGPKIVTVTGRDREGSRTAHFRITLEESEQTLEEQGFHTDTWPDIPARISWPGTRPSVAQVRVLQRTARPLTRPVLLIEGFPANYSWETIERYARMGRFADKLLLRDHDLVLVRFPSGPARLQNNAYALVEVIREVIRRRQGTDKLIVGGFSMGGLLARYALAYMEHEHRANPERMDHHQTQVYFTVDTPHEGANVPVSVQALAQYYATMGSGARAAQMRSDAAQQMLYISVPPLGEWKDNMVIGPSPLRAEFLQELARVGGESGMPREVPSTIAVANGEGTGREWLPAGALTVKFACIWWGDCFAFPRQPGATAGAGGNTLTSKWSVQANQGIGFDSAPGGVFEDPIFTQVYRSAPGGSPPVHPNACFVPTTSALAIPGLDRFFSVPDLSLSKFKYVTYSWEGNLQHACLSPTLADFLIKFIAQSTES